MMCRNITILLNNKTYIGHVGLLVDAASNDNYMFCEISFGATEV